ncbi:hypothetical protein [Helicobacter burdigaliensis]|uniref:hypothetical protein n=1 Tax=Helicobacter burdigaliensis TaxID=2315334 RepID=UPI000EF6FB38|nr:hypothetical protein [Helicobacter burdigaliensis]
MKKLRLGTKLTIVVSLVVLIIMSILTVLVSLKTSSVLQNEAHKLLQTESVRLANRVQGAISQSFAVVEASSGVMASMILNSRSGIIDEEILQEATLSVLETNQYGSFSYLYVPNSNSVYARRALETQDNNSLLQNGEFMLFADRIDSGKIMLV